MKFLEAKILWLMQNGNPIAGAGFGGTGLDSTTKTATTASSKLFDESTSRTFLLLTNNSTADVWLSLSTASAVVNAGVPLMANGGYIQLDKQGIWKGEIHAIAGSSDATIAVAEGVST